MLIFSVSFQIDQMPEGTNVGTNLKYILFNLIAKAPEKGGGIVGLMQQLKISRLRSITRVVHLKLTSGLYQKSHQL